MTEPKMTPNTKPCSSKCRCRLIWERTASGKFSQVRYCMSLQQRKDVAACEQDRKEKKGLFTPIDEIDPMLRSLIAKVR